MRYMFMLYDDEDHFHGLSAAEQTAIVAEHRAFSDALQTAGAMVEGAPLDHTRQARRVRAGRIQNGPFTDSKEQLGGYYVIEAADLDAALEWAAKCPAATYGSLEIRPIWKMG